MTNYILQRLGWAALTLAGMSVLVFLAVRMVPGDAVDVMLEGSPAQNDAAVAGALREKLGLNGNVFAAYLRWAGHAARGDFGDSIFTNESVLNRLRARIPTSFELAALATVLSLIFGVTLGVVAAANQDTIIDHVARVVAIVWLSLPGFWLGTIFIVVASIEFNWIPPIRYSSLMVNPSQNLQQMMPAAIILAFHSCAVVMRMTRSSMLDVLRQDYIRTAKAKGLGSGSLILTHALRNAIIPVITISGAQFASLVGGIVLLETVFNIPGAGRLLLDAATSRDYPQIQVCVLYVAAVVVTVNLAVDVSYGLIDPRIRLR